MSSIQHSSFKLFLVENGDSLSLLRNLIMFLPGRYDDSELVSETLYSLTNIFQTYIDLISSNIMLTHNKSTTSSDEVLPPPYYIAILKWIVLLQNVELLTEVFASERLNKKSNRWLAIIMIECLKAILRLKLLIKTNGNMLVHHSFHVPTKDIQQLAIKNKSNAAGGQSKFIEGTRRTLQDDLADQIDQRTREEEQDSTLIPLLPPCSPPDLKTKVTGELLFILRPVVYCVSRWVCGKKSWKPWLLSLLMEYSSRAFSLYGNQTHGTYITPLEGIELNRRRGLFIYYLLRSPFYDKFIDRGIIAKILTFLKRIPIVKVLVDLFVTAYRTRYFYTSCS